MDDGIAKSFLKLLQTQSESQSHSRPHIRVYTNALHTARLIAPSFDLPAALTTAPGPAV